MKKQKKENCAMQSSGVTLIALILTIIILLILAVTSVALIMRWNMLDKTEYAAEGYQGASEREILEVAFGEYAMDKTTGNEVADLKVGDEDEGTIVADKIDKNEEKNGWKVTFPSGNEYAVDKDGMIRRTSTGPLVEAVDIGDYGKKVNFKSKGEGLGDLIWRIFYKDSKNVYLISEKPNKEYPISAKLGNYTSKYTNGTDVSRQGQDLMLLAKENGTIFNVDNTNGNIKATAYLCDIAKWEDYLDAEGKAAWAMGGPTIELFAKSYNAAQDENDIICSINGKGYDENTENNWFTTTMNNGIYRLRENDTEEDPQRIIGWCLASPDTYYLSVQSECSNIGSFQNWPDIWHVFGVRPVVCIPMENFSESMIIPEQES